MCRDSWRAPPSSSTCARGRCSSLNTRAWWSPRTATSARRPSAGSCASTGCTAEPGCAPRRGSGARWVRSSSGRSPGARGTPSQPPQPWTPCGRCADRDWRVGARFLAVLRGYGGTDPRRRHMRFALLDVLTVGRATRAADNEVLPARAAAPPDDGRLQSEALAIMAEEFRRLREQEQSLHRRQAESLESVAEAVSQLADGRNTPPVAAHDPAADALRADLTARDDELQTLRADLATRDDELHTLRADLTARDDELQTLRADLATRDDELQTLRADLATRDDELQTLRADLATREDELQSLRQVRERDEVEL